MNKQNDILESLLRHLKAIQDNDVQAYRETTHSDLTLYEWWVTPHRLEGLDFHEFMMQENARRGTVFGGEGESDPETHTRYDISNLHIQEYDSTAIACYTLLVSTADHQGVHVVAHNESRVLVKFEGHWKVVHVHKSPAYCGPHTQFV
jgi:hypothetical protein